MLAFQTRRAESYPSSEAQNSVPRIEARSSATAASLISAVPPFNFTASVLTNVPYVFHLEWTKVA